MREYRWRDIKTIFPFLKHRTLSFWVERGLITPDIEDAEGTGSTRLYSYNNLIEIRFVYEMSFFWRVGIRRIKGIMNTDSFKKAIKEKTIFILAGPGPCVCSYLVISIPNLIKSFSPQEDQDVKS